jgi:hypothetical protein
LTAYKSKNVSENVSNFVRAGDIFAFYVLAEKLCWPELQDRLMDIIIDDGGDHLEIPSKCVIAFI